MKWLGFVLTLALSATVNGQSLPAFELGDLDGQTRQLPQQQEGVGIYLFWATWCPYCRSLMPHLQSIVDQYGSKVTVYAMQIRDDKPARPYMENNGFSFVVFPDADDVAEAWGMRATPGLVIMDVDQQVRFNLYDVLIEDPPGYAELSHGQKASRRAPFWAARIRDTLSDLID